MKHSFAAASVVAIALGLAGSMAVAEQQPGMQQTGQGQAGMQQQAGQKGQMIQKRVSELTGKQVVNRQGEQVGDIDKIVRQGQGGQPQAVISVGGFLGMGDKEVAVPLDRLSMQEDKIVLPQEMASKSALERQPEWRKDQYQEIADSEQVQIERAEFAAFEQGGQGTMQGTEYEQQQGQQRDPQPGAGM